MILWVVVTWIVPLINKTSKWLYLNLSEIYPNRFLLPVNMFQNGFFFLRMMYLVCLDESDARVLWRIVESIDFANIRRVVWGILKDLLSTADRLEKRWRPNFGHCPPLQKDRRVGWSFICLVTLDNSGLGFTQRLAWT
jgi:hypothetical protein